MLRAVVVLSLGILLSACGGANRFLPAAPEESYERAVVPGFDPAIRYFADATPPDLPERLREIQAGIRRQIAANGGVPPNDGRADVLALSGGGSDGAFGAGLINGWSDQGSRPTFLLITGISTGALMAPLVFLGQKYDAELERLYTNLETSDVVDFGPLRGLFGDALGLTDVSKLEARIASIITPELVQEIAAEHGNGRRLWIGTTNLDAQRPVVWDLGTIAVSEAPMPARQALIVDVLMASASIPGVFPPKQMVVEIDGKQFTEMHVDGGVTRQIFFLPARLNVQREAGAQPGLVRPGTIYALRNTKLAADYDRTRPRLFNIAGRSVSTLIKAAGVADVLVIEAQARDNGFGVAITSVPEDFEETEAEFFDPVYMRALYDVGYALGFGNTAWDQTVPEPE